MPGPRTGPSLKLLLACAVPVIVGLALLPRVIDLYQTELLIYGFTFAIAVFKREGIKSIDGKPVNK